MGKRHTLVKFPWPINNGVINKATFVNISSNVVQSESYPLDISITTNYFNIASHWLPIATSLNLMIPNQPDETHIKLPIYIELDSLRYESSMLAYSFATLYFASQEFSDRRGLI